MEGIGRSPVLSYCADLSIEGPIKTARNVIVACLWVES
jgi:hypothetical protein